MRKRSLIFISLLVVLLALSSCGIFRRTETKPRVDPLELKDVRPGMTLTEVMGSRWIKDEIFDTQFEAKDSRHVTDKLIFRKNIYSGTELVAIYWTTLVFKDGILHEKTGRLEKLPAKLSKEDILHLLNGLK